MRERASNRTSHSFRHRFAKRALETGAQITWLSRHLGHSSLKVTTDVDGHWERAERKIQVQAFFDGPGWNRTNDLGIKRLAGMSALTGDEPQ